MDDTEQASSGALYAVSLDGTVQRHVDGRVGVQAQRVKGEDGVDRAGEIGLTLGALASVADAQTERALEALDRDAERIGGDAVLWSEQRHEFK